MNGWHVSGGHHGPDHIAPMNRPSDRAPKASDAESAGDPQPISETRTEYAIRRRNRITGEWAPIRMPDPYPLKELQAAVDDYDPRFEAHVVFRTVTTTEWTEVQ